MSPEAKAVWHSRWSGRMEGLGVVQGRVQEGSDCLLHAVGLNHWYTPIQRLTHTIVLRYHVLYSCHICHNRSERSYLHSSIKFN